MSNITIGDLADTRSLQNEGLDYYDAKRLVRLAEKVGSLDEADRELAQDDLVDLAVQLQAKKEAEDQAEGYLKEAGDLEEEVAGLKEEKERLVAILESLGYTQFTIEAALDSADPVRGLFTFAL